MGIADLSFVDTFGNRPVGTPCNAAQIVAGNDVLGQVQGSQIDPV